MLNKNTCLLKSAFFPAFCHVFTSSWSNVCLFSTFPNFFPPLLTTVAACLKFFPRQKAGARNADERRHIRVQKFLKGTTTNNPEVFLTLLSIHYLNPFSHATSENKGCVCKLLSASPNCMPVVNLQLYISLTVYLFRKKKILTVTIDHMDHKVSLHVWYLTCSS